MLLNVKAEDQIALDEVGKNTLNVQLQKLKFEGQSRDCGLWLPLGVAWPQFADVESAAVTSEEQSCV